MEGTLETTCVLFISLAPIPSIEALTFLIVTYWPGIAPCIPGVVISRIFDPAATDVIGFDDKVKTLLTFLLTSWLSLFVVVLAIICGAPRASASALA